MWLKLIIFVVAAVVLYRAFGGKVPVLDSEKKASKEPDGDTLVECDTCGTFVTLKESIRIGKKYYCSKECIPS